MLFRSGKAIVTTDAGGIPEMIKDRLNGLLVAKQNPQQLAQALMNLIEDGELRKRLAKNAQESAQRFDIKHLIDQHIKLYKEITSK